MTLMNIQHLMRDGIVHHQAGRLREAERTYRAVVVMQPNHADALHLLGVVAGQEARTEEAVQHIRRAIQYRPKEAIYWCNLTKFLVDLGKLDEAAEAGQTAINLQPQLAEAHNNLGIALQSSGRFNEAILSYEMAISIKQNYAEANSNLGSAYRDAGNLTQGEASSRRALAINPNYAEGWANLGSILKDAGKLDEALACCVKAVQINPNLAVAFNNLGSVLHARKLLNEAVVAYRQAILLRPLLADAHNHLGNALKELGQVPEAVDCYKKALEIKPHFPEAMINLGMISKEEGDFTQAMHWYEKALAIRPNYAEAHWNKALLALTMGDLSTGWREYEWRWSCKHTLGHRRAFAKPQWQGESLNGKTILIHAEQGFGDTLQFIRYAAIAADRGGRVIVEAPLELKRLLQRVKGVDRVITQREEPPTFDLHCPMLSLPLATGLETWTPPKPYLSADPEEAAAWANRIIATEKTKRPTRIGLAWAGSEKHTNDHNRSLRLNMLASILALEQFSFFSLQKGKESTQATTTSIIDWTQEWGDFADTAAVIENLDLVITVDTAVAHLAAGMGKPVWLLLPWIPDCRWMMNREDTPWYPSMRLFRQNQKRDWSGVVERVARDLKSVQAPPPS